METQKLWEAEHPYYCAEGCYFSNNPRCREEHSTWKDFLEEWNEADLDMNLLFRWDWREGEDWDLTEGTARLDLFYFMQRKAYPCSVQVTVHKEQEPEIKAWLQVRLNHLMKLWAPLTPSESK